MPGSGALCDRHDVLHHADAIAEAFGLGPVRDVRPAPGGLSNELWRVTSTAGVHAVKVMRTGVDAPGFRDAVEAAYAVERAAHAGGVPCPAPLAVGDRCLVEVGGDLVRAHRWVEGRPAGPAEREQAGALLAAIHAVPEPVTAAIDDEPWDAAGWAALADGADVPTALAARLRAHAADLAGLERATAAPGLEVPHVDSHRDLDPKNVLLVEDRLVAVDWDAAGPTPAARDAAAVALDWSLVASADPATFARVLRAYLTAGGRPLPTEPWVLGGWVAATGGWLVHQVSSAAGTRLGRREATFALDRLLALHRTLDEHLDVLGTLARTT